MKNLVENRTSFQFFAGEHCPPHDRFFGLLRIGCSTLFLTVLPAADFGLIFNGCHVVSKVDFVRELISAVEDMISKYLT